MKPYTDEFNIGQAKVAKTRLDIAADEMAGSYMGAFFPARITEDFGTTNLLWRAMKRRMFAAARADHNRALAVLEVVK